MSEGAEKNIVRYVMKRFKSAVCTAALAASVAAGGMVSASAAPLQIPGQIPGQFPSQTRGASPDTATIQQVGHLRDRRFYRRGDRAYYRGHRGYRKHRRGYRRHNGYWFPPAAFIGGAIIGSILSQNHRPVYRHSDNRRHIWWCENRYRSYRAWDDTFQPYHGPRKRCNSPYD